MRGVVCVFSLLTLLSLNGVVLCDPCVTPLVFSLGSYVDPSSVTHGVVLSMALYNITQNDVSQIQITVHIPTNSSQYANSHYVGDKFDSIIPGQSFINNVPLNTSVRVSWNGVNLLTFSEFKINESVTFYKYVNGLPRWDLNFDIPADETGLGKKFPLTLEYNTDAKNAIEPLLYLTDISTDGQQHFQAYLKNQSCATGQVQGDPVFAGFQGQTFQFHGLPDEHFNLISSPDVQLNSHFVYLSSGKCDYTDTACFSHPGTYMDVLGLSVADARVKVVAGTHKSGLRLWLNDEELSRGAHIRHMSDNVTTSSLKYHHNGKIEIHTDMIRLEIVNSDMFFNIRVGLNDKELLRVGARQHSITDPVICKTNTETSNYQLVEQTVAKKYEVTTPLHGLIGQTWRNVLVCGRNWIGGVDDYLVEDLFSSPSSYSYFQW